MILISELPLTVNSQLQITKHDRPESLKTTKRIILSNYKLILIKDLSPCPRQVFFLCFFFAFAMIIFNVNIRDKSYFHSRHIREISKKESARIAKIRNESRIRSRLYP